MSDEQKYIYLYFEKFQETRGKCRQGKHSEHELTESMTESTTNFRRNTHSARTYYSHLLDGAQKSINTLQN